MRTPPFGKPLQQLLSNGKMPTNSIYMYIGYFAWEKGKMSSLIRPTRTLILPLEKRVTEYDWPVKHCEIILIATSKVSKEYVDFIAYNLFESGAEKVTFLPPDLLPIVTYKKDF